MDVDALAAQTEMMRPPLADWDVRVIRWERLVAAVEAGKYPPAEKCGAEIAVVGRAEPATCWYQAGHEGGHYFEPAQPAPNSPTPDPLNGPRYGPPG